MNSEKFKDLLMKVSTLKIEKVLIWVIQPAQMNKLSKLQGELMKLKESINEIIPATEKSLQEMETTVNEKTSRLNDLGTFLLK